MDVNSITTNNIPLASAIKEVAPEKTESTAKLRSVYSNDSISINAPLTDKTVRIGQMNDASNSAALMAKETDQKLVAVASVVDRMRETLGGIIKNYPPFPPDSQARMQLLMSYASIHKELLQMTVPPPPAPIYEQIKHQWQDLFSNNLPKPAKLPPVPDGRTPDSVLGSTISELSSINDSIGSIRASVKQAVTGN